MRVLASEVFFSSPHRSMKSATCCSLMGSTVTGSAGGHHVGDLRGEVEVDHVRMLGRGEIRAGNAMYVRNRYVAGLCHRTVREHRSADVSANAGQCTMTSDLAML